MKKHNVRYTIAIIVLIILGMFVYWYRHPTIGNKDFHLEYEVANYKQDFHNLRNKKINVEEYAYTNDTYYSHDENYKITLHSLEITDNRERIIIVTDYLGGKNNKELQILPIWTVQVIFLLLS
jgi:hypothetical protein